MTNGGKTFSKMLRKLFALLTVFAVIFSSLGPAAMPTANAAVTPTVTSLITQPASIKASSNSAAAIKVAIAVSAGETLTSITAVATDSGASGFNPATDLAALSSTAEATSGVALYNDAGATVGSFDGTDAVVDLSDASAWSSGSTTLTLAAAGAAGTYYIVYRTSASPTSAHAFTLTLPANGINMSLNDPTITAVNTSPITIDTIAPVLNTSASGPSNGATGVPISTFMHMGFKNGASGGSEMLDQTTITPANITFTTGGSPVPMALRPFPDGFDIVTSAPPTYAASSRFAKANTVSTGFFMMNGTNPINPQGTYASPTNGDIVYFQHETFPPEVGIITDNTLTSGTFKVNDFTLFGGQQITKFATPAATGAVTAATALTAGDIVVVNTTAYPTDMRYNWHIVTTGAAVNNTNLRLDGASSAPTYVSGSSFSKITPAATATDNGATGGNVLAVSQGDLAYLKVGSSYGWYLVTTAGDLSSDATENTAYINGGATDPAIAANSQMSKITSAAQGPADGTDNTAFSFGDMVFASTTANASNNGAYNFHLVTGSGTGATNSAIRFDNASSPLTSSTSYTITAGVGVKDTAGNALASPVTVTFTTGSTGSTNTTPPFVQTSTPAPGNQAFPPGVPLKIQFSVSMSTTGGAGGANSVTNPANIGIFSDNYGAPGSTVAATNAYDDATRTVTVTPSPALSVNTPYILKISPATQSATGTAMQEFRLYFRTASAADSTQPRVLGIYPASSATGVAKNVVISIGFSEDMDPATINATNITVNNGATGTVSYSPSNKTAYFTPSQVLASSTAYTVTVTTNATDLAGLNLDQDTGTGGNQNFTSSFTTGSAAISAATVMSANADNFGVAITFSQAMKVGGGPNAADNISNYSLESPVGSSISLGGKTVTYDGSTMTARISGLSLQNGNTYKVTVSNLTQDISGLGISTGGTPAGNIAQGTVADAAMTGGQLGPGSGPAQTGGQMGMTPINVMPMNRAAGATSNYSVEFPVTTSIPAGGSVVLTFPSGFDVTNAAKATAGTESFRNGDINGPMDGTVTMGVLVNNASARTITIPTAGAATGANSFISFDLKTIVNSTLPSDTGYTVDIKTKGTDGAILETKTSNPFFLGQTGSNTLTVNVFNDNGAGAGTASNNVKDGSEAGIENAMVFLFSPALGGQNTLTNASGVATFANLSNGDYMVGLEPKSVGGGSFAFNSAPQPITISGNATKNFGLAAAPYTITGTVYGPASTAVDVFASSMNGFVKASVTTNSTPVVYNSVTYPGSVTYTLPAQANTTYSVGVGPSMPNSMMMPGAPPPPPPTFTFMPPPNQEVIVTTANVPNKHFALSSADKTITGTVRDSAGTGINAAMVFARPVSNSSIGDSSVGMGTGGQTDASGNFTLNVVSGVYLVGTFKPGMPGAPDKQITVPASGANTPASLDFVLDFNSSSALTISGTIKDDGGNAIPYAGVSGRKVVSTADTTPLGGGGDNFVGGPTNSNGGYTLYVTAGTWVIEAFAPGFGKLGTKTITVGTASMSGQDFSAQTLSLGTITGRATKADVAQQGVMVRVEGANGGNMTVTDGSLTGANYSIKVPAGTYTVTCMFPGVGESTPITGVVVTADNTTANQNCALAAPITITVNITDGTNPITNAFVDARDSNGRGNGTSVSTSSGANATYTLTVPPGTYTVRAGHPAYGMIGSTSSVSTTQAITYTASAGQMYAVTGTVTAGVAVSMAWVSLDGTSTGQTNVIHIGGQTDSSGNFSISVPNGTYTYRADKPGYKSPAPRSVTVNGAAVSVGTIALTTAARTITGTVTLNSSGVSSAFVDATDGQGGFAVAQTDATGAYSLAVDNGTWSLRAHSMGYEGGPLSVTVSDNNPSNQTITLSAISGFTVKPEKQETMTPTSGGFLTNSDIGSNFKLNIPANALGTSSNSSTVTTQTNTAMPNPPTGSVLAKDSVRISAVDSSGQPIKTLNDNVTVVIPYTEANIPSGVSESSLVLGVWNDATQSYDTLSTTVDTTANTLTAITTHFSDFGPLAPAQAVVATTSATGNTASQGTGNTGNTTVTDTTPPTDTSIVIAGGAASLTNALTTLTLAATGASQMMISNTADFAAGVWEIYATAKSWTLSLGNGLKTVYAKFKDATGNISTAVSDTITLSTTGTTTDTTTTETNTATNTGTSSYSEGSLIKSSDSPQVYIIKGGKRVWIKTAEEFTAAGYNWANIVTVTQSIIDAYAEDTASSASATKIIIINTPMLRIRSLNSTNGKMLGVVKKGENYTVSEEKNGWYKIKSAAGVVGWVSGDYTTLKSDSTASTADTSVSSANTTIVIATPSLRLRSTGSTAGGILGAVKQGENYSVIDEKNGWYKIKTSRGVIGWVSGQYVTKQ